MSNEVLRSHGQIDTEPGLKFQQARFWSRVSSLHLRCCHVHCVCLPGNQAQSITCPSSSYVITWRVGRAICFRSSIFESIRPWVGREQKDYDIAIWHLQHSRHLLKQKYVVNDADFRRPPLSSVPGGEAEAETSCVEYEILSRRMTSALSCSSAFTSWSIRLWGSNILMLRHLKGKHKHTWERWVNIKNTWSQDGLQIWNQSGGFKRSL